MQFIKRWIIIGGKRQEGGGEMGGRGWPGMSREGGIKQMHAMPAKETNKRA
jgi:hypothetical protein